jgi:aryl-alcohol dehydrogenase-like predicted oxidoreductase
VQQRSIGNDTVGRVSVGAIGLGAMPLSTKEPRPSPTDAEAVVHAALDSGMTLIDTADAYAYDEAEFGHNEQLVADALRSYGRVDVLVATKGGHTRQGTDWGLDGSPSYLRRACEASLRRLHVDAIGLYQLHRPDPATPWEESMGALRSLFDDGLVRMVGVSNANIEQIDVARRIVGDALVSVQNQFSPAFRSSRPEIDVCDELGLAFLPWSPLGGLSDAKGLAEKHPAFKEVADARGVSAQQVALAWELAQSPVVIPIPGAKRPTSIIDSAAAADLQLTADEIARLDADGS